MLNPRHLISGAEIAEILGLGWKEFLVWKVDNLPVAEAPWGGQSILEEDWWYLGIVLRRHPDSQLAWELSHRYANKVRRGKFHKPQVVEASLSGVKFFGIEIAEMMGIKWKTFLMYESQPEFPECDNKGSNPSPTRKWWWASTLVAAFPNTDLALKIRERCDIRGRVAVVVDQGAEEDNGWSEV